MRVFISATKEDLDPDCRPAVRNAISIANAQAQTMEGWNPEYVQPVEVCRAELEVNSTHYIGVFAHRLGWVPQGYTVSITELEFQWVWNGKPRKPIAIFMPEPGSPIDTLLIERAAAQTEDDKKAQTEFRLRARAQNGTVSPFKSVDDLSSRVTHHVTFWSLGGLLPFARSAAASRVSWHSPPPVHLLGRAEHEEGFKRSWLMLANRGLPSIAAFLLHGSINAGQNELVKRFVEGGSASDLAHQRRIRIDIALASQKRDLPTLLARIGEEIQPGWTPRDITDLAKRIENVLGDIELVIEIRNVQRYLPGAEAGLIKDFWRPLRAAFRTMPRRPRKLFFVMDGEPNATARSFLFDPCAGNLDDFTPEQVFVLPALGSFTRGDLIVWLQSLPGGPADSDAVAAALIEETNGDPAKLLFKLIQEPLSS